MMGDRVSAPACPDTEELAAFADGRLAEQAVEQILLHLDGCEDCREVVSGSVEMVGVFERRRVRWRPAAFAAVAAAVCIGVLGWWSMRPAADDVAALVAAAGSARLTEARLSGNFSWGPMTGVRGSERTPWQVLAEVGRIEEAARRSLTPSEMRDLAIGLLLVRRPGEAVPILESLAAQDGSNPSLHADVAAAYLERARLEGTAQDLPRALEASERALALRPGLVEALFNRALALEALHLREKAIASWDAYLAVDPSSSWASEARERRDRLAEPRGPSSWDLQPERERLVAGALPQWAETLLAGGPEERVRATDVEGALDSLTRQNADPFDTAMSEHWKKATPAQRLALARGHLLYRDGLRLYDDNRLEAARPLFERSLRLLTRAGSPFRLWPTFFMALADYYAGHYAHARRTLRDLLTAADAAGYRAVSCRASWIDALIDAVSGDLSVAVPAYQRALEHAIAAREGENAATVAALLGETLDGLGRRREAWTQFRQALARLGMVRMPRRRQTILLTPALAAEQMGLAYASLALHEELAQHAGSLPLERAERAIHRARLLRRLGASGDAAGLVLEARFECDRIQDASLRSRIEPELRLAEGQVLLEDGALPAAAEAFEGALALFSTAGNGFVAPEAHLGIARAAARQGALELAEGHLVEALRRTYRRATTTEERERLTVLERSRPLARELVSLRALEDVSTAVLGWDAYQAALVAADLGPDDPSLLARWPQGRVAFVYVALDETLLRFVVDRSGVRMARLPHTRETLERWVRALRFALTQDVSPGVAAPLARDVFEALLGDEFRQLPHNTTVVFVPDEPLDSLPFAALVDPLSGMRALERAHLVVAPSLQHALVPVRDLSRSESSLVIGNPSLDPLADAGLLPLPGAGVEAADIAALLGTTPLIGSDATMQHVLELAPRARLFHYAGHAIRARGGAAALVLAPPSKGRPGRLAGSDLAWRHAFAALAVAVLAACGSSSSDGVEGEGMLGLARPFLAAGVPTVVGTLWDVDDRSSRALMVEFHRLLLTGLRPAAALRQAQLHAIAEGAGITWAAFEVVGAG